MSKQEAIERTMRDLKERARAQERVKKHYSFESRLRNERRNRKLSRNAFQ